jgi:hypothetical protein
MMTAGVILLVIAPTGWQVALCIGCLLAIFAVFLSIIFP